MGRKKVRVETKVDAVEVRDACHQQTPPIQEIEGSSTRRELPETGESTTPASRRSLLLALPAELRNEIYMMVIQDIPRIGWLHERPISDFSLRQPALARVNRQIRNEMLPMFYHNKRFGIRIHPKKHSEVDKVWEDFRDRFSVLTGGIGGVSFLSHIRSLEVELWHPAFRFAPPRNRTYWYRGGPERGVFYLEMCNGIYLQFGHQHEDRRLEPCGEGTDWTDRDSVTAALRTGLAKSRRSPGNFVNFQRTYPFERLVDLVMMITAECKQAARVVRIGTSLAP